MKSIFKKTIIAVVAMGTTGSIMAMGSSADTHVLENKPSHVVLKHEDGKWQMYRNGSPYYVKGVGGSQMLDLLAESGGNSIRTWDVDDSTLALLDEAAKRGLTVNVGLWIGHERHNFDYNDEAQVKAQYDKFKKYVTLIKDHPAVLMWGIGNEVQTDYTNSKVWDAINDISKMIHEVDENRHPTTTILCWPSKKVMKDVMTRCTDLDLLGLNSYAGLEVTLKESQNTAGKRQLLCVNTALMAIGKLARQVGALISKLIPPLKVNGIMIALKQLCRTKTVLADMHFCGAKNKNAQKPGMV